jgi:hypothetical protein
MQDDSTEVELHVEPASQASRASRAMPTLLSLLLRNNRPNSSTSTSTLSAALATELTSIPISAPPLVISPEVADPILSSLYALSYNSFCSTADGLYDPMEASNPAFFSDNRRFS